MAELAAGFVAGLAVGIAGTGWVFMLLNRREKRRLDQELAKTAATAWPIDKPARQNGNTEAPTPKARTWTS